MYADQFNKQFELENQIDINQLLNEYHELLKHKISCKDWIESETGVALSLLGLLQSPVMLHKQPCESQVNRNGDIVVGFYLDENATQSATLDINIGGVDVCTIMIQPGEFKYFFKTTYYPIITTHYTMAHVKTKDYTNLSIIYGYARTCIRKYMGTHPFNSEHTVSAFGFTCTN